MLALLLRAAPLSLTTTSSPTPTVSSSRDSPSTSSVARKSADDRPQRQASAESHTFFFSPLYAKIPQQHSLSLWALALLLLLSAPFFGLRTPSSITTQDSSDGEICVTADAANPIAADYPNSATGVLNGTMAIISVPLADVKAVLPEGVTVLEDLMVAEVTGLGQSMYPVLIQAVHDHDIQLFSFGFKLADFSRISLEFPYLSLANHPNPSKPFRWVPAQLISASNPIAISGSRDYGTAVYPASFTPQCEAYTPTTSGSSWRSQHTDYVMSATSTTENGTMHSVETVFERVDDKEFQRQGRFTFEAAKLIAAQPIFAVAGGPCDSFTRLYDVDGVDSTPIPVRGRVTAKGIAPLQTAGEEDTYRSVWGWQVATPFFEDNYLDCATLL